MSFMFEVYYRAPEDLKREAYFLTVVSEGGGHLDFRELLTPHSESIVLTYDFPSLEQAEKVVQKLRQLGEHVEGPGDYGG